MIPLDTGLRIVLSDLGFHAQFFSCGIQSHPLAFTDFIMIGDFRRKPVLKQVIFDALIVLKPRPDVHGNQKNMNKRKHQAPQPKPDDKNSFFGTS